MRIGDVLIYLDLFFFFFGALLVYILNSEFFKKKLTEKQKFILRLGIGSAVMGMSIDTFIIAVYFLHLPPFSWEVIPIIVVIFGMVIVIPLEIVYYVRRKKGIEKVEKNVNKF